MRDDRWWRWRVVEPDAEYVMASKRPQPVAVAAPARGGPIDGRSHPSFAVAVVVSSTVPPFQDFLEANRATVYRFLTVAVGPSDADDCFQETFLAALRAYPRVTRGERLDRWILRIASRKAIDHHRATARHAVTDGRSAGTSGDIDRPDARRRALGGGAGTPSPSAGGGGASARARSAVRRDRRADGNE